MDLLSPRRTRRNSAISARLLCLTVFFTAIPCLASAQKKPLKRPHHDPSTTQEAAGGFWRIDRDFDAALRIKNVLLKQPLTVTPVLYMADGTEFDLPSLDLPAAGVASVNIGRMLQNAALGAHRSTYGSASVRYHWSWAAVLATIQNTDEIESITFHSTLNTNITQLKDPSTASGPHTLQGMWWTPPQSTPSGFISLLNVTSQPLNAQLSLATAAAQTLTTRPVTIAPHATAMLTLQDLLSSITSADSTGTVSIAYTGAPGALVATAGIENRATGYSATPHITEVTSSDDTSGPVELAAPGVMIGAPDPAMLFPANTIFTPYAYLNNRTAQALQVSILAANNGGSRIPLGSVLLSPSGTAKIDLAGMIAKTGAQLGPETTNLLFSYTGQPSDLGVETGSTDQTENYVFEVSVNSEQPTISRTICYWTISGDNDTMIDLWNYTNQASDEVLTILFAGGQYKMPVHLDASAGISISLHKLQHLQTPDADGQVIPLNITEGSAMLASAAGETEHMSVAASAASFNVRNGTCGIVCTTCNGVTEFYLQPSPLPLLVQQGGQMTATATYNTGNSQTTTSGTWSSQYTSIATVDSGGGVFGMGAGSSSVTLVSSGLPPDAGTVCSDYNPQCPGGQPFASSAPTNVNPGPTITSVTPLTLGVTGGAVTITGTNFSSIFGTPTFTFPSGNATITNPIVNASTNTITASYSVGCGEGAVDSFSMSFSTAEGQASPVSGTATINLPNAPTPTILFNGNAVSGTQTVMVGQQVPLTASVSLPSCMSLASQTWGTSAGTAVGGYVNAAGNSPPDTTGGRTLNASSNTGSDTIYWTTPVSSTATYQYTMSSPFAGSTNSPVANASFSVNGPTVSNMNTPTGAVGIFSGPVLGYGPVGIQFNPTLSSTTGQYEWIQLITNDVLTLTNTAGVTQSCVQVTTPASANGTGLDTDYPYATGTSTRDSPTAALDSSKYTEEARSFSAQMFLMWNPGLPSSIYVPLGSVTWGFSGTAVYNISNWTLSSSSAATPSWNPGNSYPTWTDYVSYTAGLTCH